MASPSLRSPGPVGHLPRRPWDNVDAVRASGISRAFLDAVVNTTRSVPLPTLPRPEHWGPPAGLISLSATADESAPGGHAVGGHAVGGGHFRGMPTRFGADHFLSRQSRHRATSDDGSFSRGPGTASPSENTAWMRGGDNERLSHPMAGPRAVAGPGAAASQPTYQRLSLDGGRGSRAGRPPLPPRSPFSRVSGSGSIQSTMSEDQMGAAADTTAHTAQAPRASDAPAAELTLTAGRSSPGQMAEFSGPLIKAMYTPTSPLPAAPAQAMYAPTSPLHAAPAQLESLAEEMRRSGVIIGAADEMGGLPCISEQSVTLSQVGGGRVSAGGSSMARAGSGRAMGTSNDVYAAPESRLGNNL